MTRLVNVTASVGACTAVLIADSYSCKAFAERERFIEPQRYYHLPPLVDVPPLIAGPNLYPRPSFAEVRRGLELHRDDDPSCPIDVASLGDDEPPAISRYQRPHAGQPFAKRTRRFELRLDDHLPCRVHVTVFPTHSYHH